ncbi:uncharacterized protein [Ptychodera flava]|uniref:uncharacterized protein n=1 Tax=Ptychodera flava TaxID=63121 RepID=UPI003969CA1E
MEVGDNVDFLDWDNPEIDLGCILGDYSDYREVDLGEDQGDDDFAVTAGPATDENMHIDPSPIESDVRAESTQTCGRAVFVCPVCDREYLSVSGFRSHVKSKHGRPELKAYKHRKGLKGDAGYVVTVQRQGLWSSKSDFDEVVRSGVTEALSAMKTSGFIALNSQHSSTLSDLVSKATSVTLNKVSDILTEELYPMFSKIGTSTSLSSDCEEFFIKFHAKRRDTTFVSNICQILFCSSWSNASVYCQVFLRELLDYIIKNIMNP